MKKTVLVLLGLFLTMSSFPILADEQSDKAAKLEEIQAADSGSAEKAAETRIKGASIQTQRALAEQGFSEFLATFSTDPADLDPIRGTTWEFSYTIATVTFKDTLRFGSTTLTTGDGSVALTATNQYDSSGSVFFVFDTPIGQAFACVIEGSLLKDFYTFQITGPSATGEYKFQDKETGDYSNTYSLSGTLVSEVTTTTTIPSQQCPVREIYGDSEQTRLLRSIRDQVLIKTAEGRELIKLYYQWSPIIVRAMEGDEEFKQWIKETIEGVLPLLNEKTQ